MRYAEKQLWLALPVDASDNNSTTNRKHYQQISRTLGRQHAKLKEEPLPQELAHVWFWYLDVRTSEPLSCQELLAWITITQSEPTPFEISLLRGLDQLYWKLHNDGIRKANH